MHSSRKRDWERERERERDSRDRCMTDRENTWIFRTSDLLTGDSTFEWLFVIAGRFRRSTETTKNSKGIYQFGWNQSLGDTVVPRPIRACTLEAMFLSRSGFRALYIDSKTEKHVASRKLACGIFQTDEGVWSLNTHTSIDLTMINTSRFSTSKDRMAR